MAWENGVPLPRHAARGHRHDAEHPNDLTLVAVKLGSAGYATDVARRLRKVVDSLVASHESCSIGRGGCNEQSVNGISMKRARQAGSGNSDSRRKRRGHYARLSEQGAYKVLHGLRKR